MSSTSKEYNTIRVSRNSLRIGFKADILTLASSLVGEDIITENVYETATTPSIEKSVKTEAMVKAVLVAVQQDVKYYHKMMDILKQKREYNSLVIKLNEQYKKQGGTKFYEPCTAEYVQIKVPTKTVILQRKIKLMNHLRLIKYYVPGKHKKLQIIQELAFHWEEVADQLGFSQGEVGNIKNPGSGKTREQCFKDVLTKWLANAGRMPNSDRYPCTWEGLHNLMEDTNQSSLANDLNEAIEAEYGDLQDNYKSAPTENAEMPPVSTNVPSVSAPPTTIPVVQSAPVTPSPAQPDAQPPSNASQARSSRPRKNKETLAVWLLEQGMEQEDVDFLKGKGVSELIFMKIKPGDKYSTGLTEGGNDLVPILQDELKAL